VIAAHAGDHDGASFHGAHRSRTGGSRARAPVRAGVRCGLAGREVMAWRRRACGGPDPGTAEFELVIGGMTCAACAARVQARLNKLAGVTASVNLSTERAYVTAPAQIPARPGRRGRGRRLHRRGGRSARGGRRGGCHRRGRPGRGPAAARQAGAGAGVLCPADRPVRGAVRFPWTRFPGWQWLLVALAAPVAIWAAWPFHAAALRQARHLSSSMDTLVSLGILAACGWSVYAMFVLDRARAGRAGCRTSCTAPVAGSTWRWPPR
jgi:cation transport ATPase